MRTTKIVHTNFNFKHIGLLLIAISAFSMQGCVRQHQHNNIYWVVDRMKGLKASQCAPETKSAELKWKSAHQQYGHLSQLDMWINSHVFSAINSNERLWVACIRCGPKYTWLWTKDNPERNDDPVIFSMLETNEEALAYL